MGRHLIGQRVFVVGELSGAHPHRHAGRNDHVHGHGHRREWLYGLAVAFYAV